MWLMTPIGFFSIVCKPDDVASGTLTIRARVKSDLEALRRDFLPRMTAIVEGGGTDYPYRAKAPRSEIAEAIAQVIRRIDYGISRMRLRHDRVGGGPPNTVGCGAFFTISKGRAAGTRSRNPEPLSRRLPAMCPGRA